MGFEKSYYTLFIVLKTKFKIFVIIGLLAIVTATIFSSSIFISPKYKSEADLYPSNLFSYSNESATEQMLQLFFGNDIRDSIVVKYNLINHYDIDTTSEGFNSRLIKQYHNNILIKKTNFESVHIEVLDTDPILAKKIAEELIKQVNIKIKLLHQLKAKEVLVINENELLNKKMLIDTLEAEIKAYSIKYGLLDYTQQSREVTAGYMNMLLENKKGESMEKAEELYGNLKKEGRHFQDLHHQLSLAREDYNKLLISYDATLRDVNKKLTYTNTIVSPEVADKKSYPIRWLIVVLSFIGSILFTFIILSFYNRLKQQ